MLVLNAHGYSLVGSEPIFVANNSGEILALALSNATNRTQIGSELAWNRHFKIVPELWITLYYLLHCLEYMPASNESRNKSAA